ncbi:MAG: hypothetical protein J5I90_19790 [Caldilineales bacterium]|nr:hypothetical protein [Caldilineales bacterium]
MPDRPAILTQRYILRFWAPLAVMWLMMAIEQPVLAAVIARMSDATLNLAAFGVTFALALLIESPIIMLLVAGTALAKGRQSYNRLLVFTIILTGALSGLHLLLVLTPAYDWIIGRLIGAPPELMEPSRQAFFFMLPWTAAVAFRRLWQGVMIRHGKTDQVSLTTVARLLVTGLVVIVGMARGGMPGASLAGLALSAGVITGAVVARIFVNPILHGPLHVAEPEREYLSWRALLDFYIPLALTNMINFLGRPLLTLGLSRALLPLESLALWPVLMSLAFLFRSLGFGYQEVVVALLRDEHSLHMLKRFGLFVGLVLSALLVVIAVTPLNGLWYGRISGLTPDLVSLAGLPTLVIGLTPLAAFLIASQRGILVHLHRTRPITAAVAINLTVLALTMWLGMQTLALPGVLIASAAFALSIITETLFLSTQTRTASARLAPVETIPA